MSDETTAPGGGEQKPALSEAAASTLQALSGLPGMGGMEEEFKSIQPENQEGAQQPDSSSTEEQPPATPENQALANSANSSLEDNEGGDGSDPNNNENKGPEAGESNPDGEADLNGGDDSDKTKDDSEEEFVIESPIFAGGKNAAGDKAKKDVKPIEFEGAEKVNNYIKEQTGYENLEALMNSSLENKEKITQFDDIVTKATQYENVFKNMPSELYEAVDMHLKGKDWKTSLMSRPNLDFNQDVDNHSDKALVDSYFPGKFTEAEWENFKSDEPEEGIKKAIEIAVDQAKTKYTSEREAIVNYRENEVKQAQEINKVITQSVDKSIEYLKNNIEGLDDGYVSQAKKNLNVQKLTEMFLNPDGTFKEDAAYKMTMAEHGPGMLKQYAEAIKRKTETKERSDILERTPDKPKATITSSAPEDGVRPEVQQVLKGITESATKPLTY